MDKLTALLAGKRFSGKSTLINTLIGEKKAPEALQLGPGTRNVQSYHCKYGNTAVTFVDTPGFDVDVKSYVADIITSKSRYDIDVMLYCVDLSDTRIRREDFVAISAISDECGEELWNKAIFVMTFANKVLRPNHDFTDRLERWRKELVRGVVRSGVDQKIAESIPIRAVGHREWQLTDCNNWQEALLNTCLHRKKEH